MKTAILFLIIAIVAAFCSANVAIDAKCKLPISHGTCDVFNRPMYGYDVAKNACVEFQYGGCGGNDNKFVFKSDCEEACMGANNFFKDMDMKPLPSPHITITPNKGAASIFSKIFGWL